MKQLLTSSFKALLFILTAMGVTGNGYAGDMNGMRLWQAPDRTRVVFDVSQPVVYKLFTLKNPSRVVIDIEQIKFKARIPAIYSAQSVIKSIRTAQFNKNTFRVVFDINQNVTPNAFQLAPNAQYGQRLVVDLNHTTIKSNTQTTKALPASFGSNTSKHKKLIVAIDAGHGGEDPGAIGKKGTREKDVVLQVAKKLAKRINKDRRMKAVLIRKGDYYVGLGKRTKLARDYDADLFVSVHADAVKKRSVRGSSVYALSDKRATSEIAKWLANKENASDIAGGVSISDKDDDVAGLLLDLQMDNTKSESIIFAKDVLHELKRLGPVLHNKVERASFSVLKSPDIPSILVEAAFISNLEEEKKLKNKKFQNRLADSIFNGIKRYAERSTFSTLAGN